MTNRCSRCFDLTRCHLVFFFIFNYTKNDANEAVRLRRRTNNKNKGWQTDKKAAKNKRTWYDQ